MVTWMREQDWRLDRGAHVAISAAAGPSPRAGRTPPQAAGPSPAQPQVLPDPPIPRTCSQTHWSACCAGAQIPRHKQPTSRRVWSLECSICQRSRVLPSQVSPSYSLPTAMHSSPAPAGDAVVPRDPRAAASAAPALSGQPEAANPRDPRAQVLNYLSYFAQVVRQSTVTTATGPRYDDETTFMLAMGVTRVQTWAGWG